MSERRVRQHCRERWTEKKGRERDTQADRWREMERDPETVRDGQQQGGQRGTGDRPGWWGPDVGTEMGQDGFRVRECRGSGWVARV